MTERFTLLSELGRGGMGVVWKARDEESGSIVALKLLRETYAEDPEYLARFERELELARRIDSNHVVKVLGFGVRGKVPYLALEYVAGPSLHDALVAHGRYGWPEARALLAQLAQDGMPAHMAQPFLVGVIAAALSGLAAIWFVLSYLRTHTFTIFIVYRLVVASALLIVIATGFRHATGI